MSLGEAVLLVLSTTLFWVALFVVFFRCRLGWHAWPQWLISGDGCSQYRICTRCRFYQVRFIIDKTTGNTVKVTFPKPATRDPDFKKEEAA